MYFLMHWFAVNTVLQKHQLSYIVMLLKMTSKESRQEESIQNRPVFRSQDLVDPVNLKLVLQRNEASHCPGKSLSPTETMYKRTW